MRRKIMIKRSQEIVEVAYYLSKFGRQIKGQKYTLPPIALKVKTWNEAYDIFFAALGNGRSKKTFRYTLKNSRDSFDSHLGKSGRAGWRNTDSRRSPARLTKQSQEVLIKFETLNEQDVFEHIMKLTTENQNPKKKEHPALKNPTKTLAEKSKIMQEVHNILLEGMRKKASHRSKRTDLIGQIESMQSDILQTMEYVLKRQNTLHRLITEELKRNH